MIFKGLNFLFCKANRSILLALITLSLYATAASAKSTSDTAASAKSTSAPAASAKTSSVKATSDQTASTRAESNILLGVGASSFTDGYLGVAMNVTYGLDTYLSSRLSLMPFARIGFDSEALPRLGAVGADFDDFSYAALGLGLRYHFENIPLIIGLAPYANYIFTDVSYYIDADPSDPRSNLSKWKHLDYGIQPGIYWNLEKHLRLGLEACVGLRNLKIQYPEYGETGSTHVNAVCLTVGWHF